MAGYFPYRSFGIIRTEVDYKGRGKAPLRNHWNKTTSNQINNGGNNGSSSNSSSNNSSSNNSSGNSNSSSSGNNKLNSKRQVFDLEQANTEQRVEAGDGKELGFRA